MIAVLITATVLLMVAVVLTAEWAFGPRAKHAGAGVGALNVWQLQAQILTPEWPTTDPARRRCPEHSGAGPSPPTGVYSPGAPVGGIQSPHHQIRRQSWLKRSEPS